MDILERLGTNPTQLAGLISYAMSALACFTLSRLHYVRDRKTWGTIAFVDLVLWIDILFELRWKIHYFVSSVFLVGDHAMHRDDFKTVLLVVMGIAVVVLIPLYLAWPRAIGWPARCATLFAIWALLLLGIDLISLKTLDVYFFRAYGPVALIGWLWVAGALSVCIAAFVEFVLSQRTRYGSVRT